MYAPLLQSSGFLISDQYCHHRSDNYILLPRNVGPRYKRGCFLASARYTQGTNVVKNTEEMDQLRRVVLNLPTPIPHDYGGSSSPAHPRVKELTLDCSKGVDPSLLL